MGPNGSGKSTLARVIAGHPEYVVTGGEVKYEGGRIPIPATFTASPVAFEGKILMTSEDGDTFMIKAGPKHEVVGTNSVGEPVYASPAIADGRIFIRGEKNLYCIGT